MHARYAVKFFHSRHKGALCVCDKVHNGGSLLFKWQKDHSEDAAAQKEPHQCAENCGT